MSAHGSRKTSHDSHKRNRHSHDHGHQHDGSKSSAFVREWFWGCCNCDGHGSMSTFIEQCPGCSHARCFSCPMEDVGIRAAQIVASKPTAASPFPEVFQATTSRTEPAMQPIEQFEHIRSISSSFTSENAPASSMSDSLGSNLKEFGRSRVRDDTKRPWRDSMEVSESIGEESLVYNLIQPSCYDSGNLPGKTTKTKSSRKPALRKDIGISLGAAKEDPNISDPLLAPQKFFACHFYKLDPRKYGPWTDLKFASCPGLHVTKLRYIKRHLEDAHTQAGSLVSCKRCLRSFEDTNKLHDHYRAPEAYELSRISPHANEEIQEYQWEEINRVFNSHKGKKHVDDESRWCEIWRIIFPGMDEPLSTRIEQPGYIALSSFGIDELRLDFECRIEEDVQNGNIRDDQTQRLLDLFQQTLEAYSANLGMLRLTSPESRQQGYQERTKESSSVGYTQLISAPASSEMSLAQKKDQSLGIDDALTESALSPFCGGEFESEAAYYLAQSALSQATPHPEDDSYS